MSEQLNSGYTLTAPVVMGHPSLAEPKKYKDRSGKEKGDPKFGAIFCLDPNGDDLKAIKGVMAAVAKAKWPDVALNTIKFPIVAGEKNIEKRVAKLKAAGKDYKNDADFQKGTVVIKASSKYRPQLSFVEGGKLREVTDETLAIHKGKFYFGVKALAKFNFVAYETNEGAKGVTAYLDQVLSTNKGERISGGASAADVFKGYVGNLSAEDPTGGVSQSVEDEIQF